MQSAIITLSVINGTMILILIYFIIVYVVTNDKSQHTEHISVASKEEIKIFDDTLGLVKVSTYLDENLYNKTIYQICTSYGIIPAAALRRLIEIYESRQWISIADQEGCEHLFEGELVLIKDDNETGYLFGSYDIDKKEWLHVDEQNNHHALPKGFNVTHWKILD